MPFQKVWLNSGRSDKATVLSASHNPDEINELFELGSRLRQTKYSTIIKQAVKIALAKLQQDEFLTEILLGNERKNRRSGTEELNLIQQDLAENLKIIDKTK